MGFEWIVAYLVLGAFVGVMAGLLGIGGGGIMVPILTTFFLLQGVEPDKVVHLALGTSMASIVVTSFASMMSHNKKKAVLWGVVKVMAGGIILGTFASTFLASSLNSTYLAIIFTIFMSYTAFQMIADKKPKPSRGIVSNPALFGTGGIIGVISALVSIGGGTMSVPFLVWQNVNIKNAIATSAAIGFPISIAGTIGYAINGYLSPNDYGVGAVGFVYLPAVICISMVSYFTVPYGVKLAHSLPIATLKKIFAILLFSLSLKMLFSIV